MLLGPDTFKTADDDLFFPVACNSGTRGDRPVIKSFQSFGQLAMQPVEESGFSVQVQCFCFRGQTQMPHFRVAARLQNRQLRTTQNSRETLFQLFLFHFIKCIPKIPLGSFVGFRVQDEYDTSGCDE